jgi:hypothetical protein
VMSWLLQPLWDKYSQHWISSLCHSKKQSKFRISNHSLRGSRGNHHGHGASQRH